MVQVIERKNKDQMNDCNLIHYVVDKLNNSSDEVETVYTQGALFSTSGNMTHVDAIPKNKDEKKERNNYFC